MQFEEGNIHISKKKINYPINEKLFQYLLKYGRAIHLPVNYSDLLGFDSSVAVYDKQGRDSLWASALYSPNQLVPLHEGLIQIYSILKTGGDGSVHEHLHVERIDYCTFGNSNPFRIKIVNNYNDNYDYFYIKKRDASRVYGLELEDILSPTSIPYFTNKQTLVEEHIAGIPGDQFIQHHLSNAAYNQVRIAKEFIKFNERCFVRLLGDMRAYNYVFDITPDFEEMQFRIRAIDFDQQSYEGRRNLYLPQFFKENLPLVKLVQQHINAETVKQYQSEERALIARRVLASLSRISELLDAMIKEELAPLEKLISLRQELAEYFQDEQFLNAKSMGEIILIRLNKLLDGKAEIKLIE